MKKRVVVWGTGNVGRPALRAVLAHPELELVGVVVSNPAKLGLDAGEIAGVAPTGIRATTDGAALLAAGGVDTVAYTATADGRPMEAFGDLFSCLQAGVDVVSTSFYPLLYPPAMPAALRPLVAEACARSGSSVFVSGVDPGWAMDVLPIVLSGMVAGIREVRCQEIMNYASYDQPLVVRSVIGFGGPMDEMPRMLQDEALRMVWEPMVRLIGEGLGYPVEHVDTVVQRRPLARAIDVPGMGHFEAGTQGAFRFEVRGFCGGVARYVIEHVTRIDDDCAPDWPSPPEGRGCHRVMITGSPTLNVTLHCEDAHAPGPAGGGNATAANRIINLIPAVFDAPAGVLTALDLPPLRSRPAPVAT